MAKNGWGKAAVAVVAALAPQATLGGIFGPGIVEDVKFAIETGGIARLNQINFMIDDMEERAQGADPDLRRDIERWITNLEAERDRISDRMKEELKDR